MGAALACPDARRHNCMYAAAAPDNVRRDRDISEWYSRFLDLRQVAAAMRGEDPSNGAETETLSTILTFALVSEQERCL
jgi:hypothetical protein